MDKCSKCGFKLTQDEDCQNVWFCMRCTALRLQKNIEQLQAELDQIRKSDAREQYIHQKHIEIDKLTTNNIKFRKALEEIANDEHEDFNCSIRPDSSCTLSRIAKQALEREG